MKLGLRIFFFYLAIFAVCLYFATDWIWTTLRSRYLESVEEPLVDAANLLASLVEQEMARPDFTWADLEAPLARAHARALSAHIYNLEKRSVDLQLYITDAAGKVVFDTRQPSEVGSDYSRFHDVKFTLAGRYGARASQSIPEDPFSTVLYIGAPIYRDGRVAGRQYRGLPPTRPSRLRPRRLSDAGCRGFAEPRPHLRIDPSHPPPRPLRGRHPSRKAPVVPFPRAHRDRGPGARPEAHAGDARRAAIRGGVRPDSHP
jgi:two-component system sensor histidine kinase CreC